MVSGMTCMPVVAGTLFGREQQAGRDLFSYGAVSGCKSMKKGERIPESGYKKGGCASLRILLLQSLSDGLCCIRVWPV